MSLVIQQTAMKATILAVGTEITNGQIINKNASWIAENLRHYGIETIRHLAVPDDRKLINAALRFCENQCENEAELIFVTGGLGPTTDDFTRDVICEWSNTKSIFDETSWQHVQERLTSRGFTVKEFQRQQCYFPEGAKVLSNSEGTANGFFMEVKKDNVRQYVFVLPGPPREISAIWEKHIESWLKENTTHIDKQITRIWDTIGLGESDVAALVEPALSGRSENFPLAVGYRVHLPYVEVKLSYPESTSYTSQMYVERVEKVIEKITVLRDFQEATSLLVGLIKDTEFAFYDFTTHGFLHHRLSSRLKNIKRWLWREGTSADAPDVDFFHEEKNFIALLPDQEAVIENLSEATSNQQLKCRVLFDLNGRKGSALIEAPMRSPLMQERRRQYFAEMAMLVFVKRFN